MNDPVSTTPAENAPATSVDIRRFGTSIKIAIAIMTVIVCFSIVVFRGT